MQLAPVALQRLKVTVVPGQAKMSSSTVFCRAELVSVVVNGGKLEGIGTVGADDVGTGVTVGDTVGPVGVAVGAFGSMPVAFNKKRPFSIVCNTIVDEAK